MHSTATHRDHTGYGIRALECLDDDSDILLRTNTTINRYATRNIAYPRIGLSKRTAAVLVGAIMVRRSATNRFFLDRITIGIVKLRGIALYLWLFYKRRSLDILKTGRACPKFRSWLAE